MAKAIGSMKLIEFTALKVYHENIDMDILLLNPYPPENVDPDMEAV